ncbi:MAG: nitroreductase [Methanospirillum sp.]
MTAACAVRVAGALLLLALALLAAVPVQAEPFSGYNNIFVSVANDAGPHYDSFDNGTYSIRFEGETRGQNALHVTTDPSAPYGQVTFTSNRSGTLYVSDTGGKGYEDDCLLLVSVREPVPDDFRFRVVAHGHRWTPNPISNRAPETYTYAGTTLDETFTAADLRYGPQSWRPCGGPGYPVYDGQETGNESVRFRSMFVDLNAGVLGRNASGVGSLPDKGAVRVEYTLEGSASQVALNAYAFCNLSNNGATMIAWTNRLVGGSGYSGYTVNATPGAAMAPFAGQAAAPRDLDGDGRYEDVDGNGRREIGDAVILALSIDEIRAHRPIAAFDFDRDGRVGLRDALRLLLGP